MPLLSCPSRFVYQRLAVAVTLLLIGVGSAWAQHTVAVTLDDLPYAGGSLDAAIRATDALLGALARYEAPADVFVEGRRVEVAGEATARRALLRRWRDAGHVLHNHSYSHLRYSQTNIPDYLADVERGHAVVEALRQESRISGGIAFFRPPFNDLGETAATREALTEALDRRGVRLAPFTVEHADWLFNAVYEDALSLGDSARAGRVGEAYVAQLDSAFAFAEHLAAATFGRAIPHVLLLHANRINADYLGAMLERLRQRGYRFVTLEDAVADPAYASADAYTERWGVSWLHRWRVALDLPNVLRDEPEPPAWVLEAYQDLVER